MEFGAKKFYQPGRNTVFSGAVCLSCKYQLDLHEYFSCSVRVFPKTKSLQDLMVSSSPQNNNKNVPQKMNTSTQNFTQQTSRCSHSCIGGLGPEALTQCVGALVTAAGECQETTESLGIGCDAVKTGEIL